MREFFWLPLFFMNFLDFQIPKRCWNLGIIHKLVATIEALSN
nr:MAG TPA: hypothetical protein [Caudoviricetes sp.]DAH98258.1 MAG TPA: hypothetical protein [Caudoviricetes sp.]